MTKRMLFALGLTVSLAACNPQPPRTTPSPSPSAPGLSTLALRITGSGTPRRPIRIVQSAKTRRIFDLLTASYQSRRGLGSTHATLRDVRVVFYARSGARLTAEAPSGMLDEERNEVTLQGGVDASSSTGLSLHCRLLVFRHADDTVHGDGDVRVKDVNGMRLSGTHFDSDISLAHMQVR